MKITKRKFGVVNIAGGTYSNIFGAKNTVMITECDSVAAAVYREQLDREKKRKEKEGIVMKCYWGNMVYVKKEEEESSRTRVK